MKFVIPFLICILLLAAGCSNETDHPTANKPPKSFFWIFPDSTTLEGHSKQHIHWWGQDPDGIVQGYLIAIGKFLDSAHTIANPDTIHWCYTTQTDSLLAFPLVTKRDTFDVAVRAVDNTFKPPTFSPHDTSTVEHAIVRLKPFPYWDRNVNGIFDSNDIKLPTLTGAYDPVGATQPMPIRNQPPSIFYSIDPNNLTAVFQQPDTTFTAATFSWYGTDPDGDATISKYIICLNDTTNLTQRIVVPGRVHLVTLIVPRSISDTATTYPVVADVDTGTFSSPPQKIGTIGGMKINALNKFYIQAVDVAGDSSHYISMPSGTGKWYVKKPHGRLLIVDDYAYSDSTTALSFYQNIFPQVGAGQFTKFDVMKIAQGLTLDDKNNQRVGRNVPPFYDPALIFTFHLYDVVLWYTDMYPSLNIALVPLYEYVHNPLHPGKVIYTTSFATSVDPSGALEGFAPIDSINQVDLVSPSRPLPSPGDARLPGGYYAYADSTNPDIFPDLQFSTARPTINPIYIRPLYKRSDARYIYHLQTDIRNPIRYVNTVTLDDFRAVSTVGANAWACGVNGILYHTSNAGQSWTQQTKGNLRNLNAIQFLDANNGWSFGDFGLIGKTTNGGNNWVDHSLVTIASFNGCRFVNSSLGFVVGTFGTILKTTNGGANWQTYTVPSQRNLYGVSFINSDVGIIAGDSTVLHTSDGGTTWIAIPGLNTHTYYSVAFGSGFTAFAVGSRGTVAKLTSTDNGTTWNVANFTLGTGADLHSISFPDTINGWICGNTGVAFKSSNSGTNWATITTGVSQNLLAVSFVDPSGGWSVGTLGTILRTDNGGSTWYSQPQGTPNVGVIDGQNSFVFLGVPLHLLDGKSTVKSFLEHVLFQEFGLQ